MPMAVGYARVSTQEQDLALQLDALQAAGCARIYTEKASGAQRDRPQLQAALDYMRPGRYAGGLEARPAGAVPAATARHGRSAAQPPDWPALADRSHRHQHARVARWSFISLARWRNLSARSSGNAPGPASPPPGPAGAPAAGPPPSLPADKRGPGAAERPRHHRGGGGAPLAGLAGDAVSPLARGPEWPGEVPR